MLFWFNRTHELRPLGLGGLMWVRTHLPTAGGLDEQDARLHDALDHVRGVRNALLAEAHEAQRNRDD